MVLIWRAVLSPMAGIQCKDSTQNLFIKFLPDVSSLDYGVPSTPCGFGSFPLSPPLFKGSPLYQEAQNSAGPLLVYFASRLLGFRATEGWGKSRQGVELEEDADHTNSATVRITTGGTNEDHICQAWHKRRPSQSQTQTLAKVGEWETLGLPCAKNSERMGGVCIFKDSCQRQEVGEFLEEGT